MTLSFQPINDAHAIVELVFFFNFSSNFKNDIFLKLNKNLKDKHSNFSKDTPVYKLEHQVKMNSQNNPTVDSKQTLSGFELESFDKDGELDWGLSISDNKLLIHCLNYSTWEKVWKDALSYISEIFETISYDDSLKISNFGLKYLDKFVYSGRIENYSSTDIFKTENNFLTKNVLDSGSVWHCHSGWFEDLSEEFIVEDSYVFKCLNQLNVESNATSKDNHEIIVSIDHGTFLIPKKVIANDNEFGIEVNKIDISYISKSFELLHAKNKKVLKELLNEDMCERIDL